jgi:putative hydrolase of the HAD superfamily
VHWAFLCENLALDRLCPAVLSHECGIEKPDAEIYLLAAQALDAAPEDCLFVDDKAANVEGARAVGMRAHLFTGLDGLRAALNTQA